MLCDYGTALHYACVPTNACECLIQIKSSGGNDCSDGVNYLQGASLKHQSTQKQIQALSSRLLREFISELPSGDKRQARWLQVSTHTMRWTCALCDRQARTAAKRTRSSKKYLYSKITAPISFEKVSGVQVLAGISCNISFSIHNQIICFSS